jgi:Sulfotransferase family
MASDRLDRDRLLAEAMERTGEVDLGDPSWEEGFDILLDSLRDEANLNELGMEIALAELTAYLSNRLMITAWRTSHPEIVKEAISRPIVIVGQPRTGTTILYDLLGQDPDLRVPLTWEVDRPMPPPETATYGTDPRIDEVQASIDMAESLMPGFTTFHPVGALLGQECVRMTASDFRSMIFPTQYRLPNYNHWLLHVADLGPTYQWHRRYLQHLQSRHPAEQWLLKSPAHLWHLEALAAEYPDALIIQTHRDPLKVIASTSALATHLRRMASDEVSITETASSYADDIFLGLDRGIEARQQGTFPPEHVIDVHYSEFIADPLSEIREIYAALGRELDGLVENQMRSFLASHPGNDGGDRYSFADTALDGIALRERSKPYLEYFNVATEPVN